MLKLSKVAFIILNIFLFLSTTVCYAVVVNDNNLNTTLQKFVSSDTNDKNYKITVYDKVITITSDGKSCTLNYDLTNKPTFSLEIPIQKGMTYADFKDQTENMIVLMIGYVAVANIQGVEFEDASAYFLMSYLENTLSGSMSNKNPYTIVDDTDLSDGITIDKTESDSKTIYVSEFGERVMEYTNAIYKDKQTITDATSGINSYEWITERKDITENSCKLVSSLSVNTNANFSTLEGYANQMGESFLNKDITKDNADYPITLKVGQKCRFETTEKITGHEMSGSGCDYKEINENCAEIIGTSVGKANGYINIGGTKKSFYITVEKNTDNKTLEPVVLKVNTSNGNNNPSENKPSQEQEKEEQQKPQQPQPNKDNTTAQGKLPQTGVSNTIYVVIAFSIIVLAVFGIKFKKYRDIK